MTKADERREALIAKIHRMQQRGLNAERQIKALSAMMRNQQNQRLRTLSNKRFGKRKAREFKKTKGYLSFSH